MMKSLKDLVYEYLPNYTAHIVMNGDIVNTINEFRGDYFFLSNFYFSPIYYDGRSYPTLEHAFQAAKTLNLDERWKILSCETPGQAKIMGKTVTLRPDWDVVKISIMLELLHQKFRYLDLRNLLLSTRGMDLIEGNNWGDKFWGQCDGEGHNFLGRLLMEVREHSEVTGPPFAS